MSEPADQVQHERKHDAEQDRSCNWKIESRVFAAIDNVAGKSPKRRVGSPQQDERNSRDNDDRAQENQQLSKICHVSF